MTKSDKETPKRVDLSKMASNRRISREISLKTLYAWLLNNGGPIDIIRHDFSEEVDSSKVDNNYLELIVHGVKKNIVKIENLLNPIIDRKFKSVSPIERAILLIATYEMMEHKDIPFKVVINEAVELTKDFGGTEGYKYVNGVLDKLADALRSNEKKIN